MPHNLCAHLDLAKKRERMAMKQLLTSVKFATLQWSDVLRCAVRNSHDMHDANVEVDQLESRVLYSASPLPVEAAESADSEQADTAAGASQSTATSQDDSPSTGPDSAANDIRTSDDSLSLLDEVSFVLLPTLAEETQSGYEVVSVDPSADDNEQLVADLTSDAESEGTGSSSSLLQFSTNGGNILGFTQDSILVASSSHLFDVRFVGANLGGPVATDSVNNATELAASAPVGAATFTGVTYAGLWDGVTAVFDSQEGAILKSTYYVDAGLGENAVDQIRLQYNRDVSLDALGNLVITYDTGTMTDSAPVAWQDIDGQRIFVDVHYALLGDNQVGFTVGDYDQNYQLVIDPTLTWSTFLGGSGTDDAQFIAIDGSGNIYVTGSSSSSWGSPVQAFGGGGNDAYVAKLNSSGSVVWTTFLGGSGADVGHAIAVDASGNIYVSGDSSSTWGSPVRAISSGTDGFAAKLNSSGTLLWNTFLGGSGSDTSWGIGIDGSGNVYVSGDSAASWGSPLRSYSNGSDVYAAKLNSSGSLMWNTFLGGSGSDINNGIAVDTSGNVYVGGYSTATWGTPVRAYTSGQDFSIIKLNTSGSIIWNTFLGGSGTDAGLGIAIDGSSNVYVTGNSSATWGSPVQDHWQWH